jgi:gluconate 2-dehydrogenase gamma chain
MDDVTEPVAPAAFATAGAFDRRSALVGSLALAALAACQRDGAVVDAGPAEAKAPAPEPTKAQQAFLPVMVAIADRLLPSDEAGPGAKDVDVGAFFARVFADPRLGTIHPLVKRGCAFLMKAARLEAQKSFTALDDAQRDELLLRLSENRMRPDGFHGPTFVRVMLALTLEGFLCDPRHGGNKDRQGWAVVGYSPDGRAEGLAIPAPGAGKPGLKVVP